MTKIIPAANKDAMIKTAEAKKLLFHARELAEILDEYELTGIPLETEELEKQVLEHVDSLHEILRRTKIGYALPRWQERRAQLRETRKKEDSANEHLG